jgi:maltose alpha-D-glucosyltransferase/alpha-amylase
MTLMIDDTADLWWKNAVFYCLDVETFFDGNGDGCGDFNGLTQRVDYLADLGVTCLWLMPFYPSPNRDDGYDIIDYYGVDAHLGTLGEFVEFMRTARDRGLKVIADLVVNHTSREHPWFQAARADRNSPFHDFYVWRDEPPEDRPKDLVFPDKEDSNWEWDEKAGRYFLHRFYKHQPDLNIVHPAVRQEIARIAGLWLELGLSGFRVDAVPFLLETTGVETAPDLDPHKFLRDLRAFLGRRCGDAILLGEVNLEPEEQRRFFGDEDGDELHMCLNFNVNQAMALALVRGDATPLVEALRALVPIPEDAQFGNFVRNHDEWSLDKLSEEEREEVFAAFGPDPDMQLFGRGLRRRLPTMLGGDQARLRMAYSLMFALPGAPVLFYGEEIGMAENLAIEGRMSVRAPMQWSNEPNAGFSTAAPEKLRRPVVSHEEYGPAAVNVADQRRDRGSLLSWMARLIRTRRECPEIGWGKRQLLESGARSVLAQRFDWAGRTLIVLHNLADEPNEARLDLEDRGDWESVSVVFGEEDTPNLRDGVIELELEPYGCRWLRVRRRGQRLLP